MCLVFVSVCAHSFSHSFDNLRFSLSPSYTKINATRNTKMLHLGPVQILYSRPHAESVNRVDCRVTWEGSHLLNVAPPRCISCCTLLRTRKPSVLSAHIQLKTLPNHHDSLFQGRSWMSSGHSLPLLPPRKPHLSLIPTPQTPPHSRGSAPTNTFRTP